VATFLSLQRIPMHLSEMLAFILTSASMAASSCFTAMAAAAASADACSAAACPAAMSDCSRCACASSPCYAQHRHPFLSAAVLR
jgi:hypothetical protein